MALWSQTADKWSLIPNFGSERLLLALTKGLSQWSDAKGDKKENWKQQLEFVSQWCETLLFFFQLFSTLRINKFKFDIFCELPKISTLHESSILKFTSQPTHPSVSFHAIANTMDNVKEHNGKSKYAAYALFATKDELSVIFQMTTTKERKHPLMILITFMPCTFASYLSEVLY